MKESWSLQKKSLTLFNLILQTSSEEKLTTKKKHNKGILTYPNQGDAAFQGLHEQ